MKKLTGAIACTALALSFNLAMPQVASASANDEVGTCRILVDAEVFESLGECVGAFRSGPAKFCKRLDEQGFLGFFGWKNRGDCVSSIREFN